MRVYEYTNQDGQVFWSFERLRNPVTLNQKLVLEDLLGVFFNQYVAQLRLLQRAMLEDGYDDADPNEAGDETP